MNILLSIHDQQGQSSYANCVKLFTVYTLTDLVLKYALDRIDGRYLRKIATLQFPRGSRPWV